MMGVKKVKRPVAAAVEVERNKSVVEAKSIPLGAVEETAPMANVGFCAAYTKNLGNYESLKITVSLYLPVVLPPQASTDPLLDKAFEYAQNWVDAKINAVLAEMDE